MKTKYKTNGKDFSIDRFIRTLENLSQNDKLKKPMLKSTVIIYRFRDKKTIKEIMTLTGLSERTIYNYIKDFFNDNIQFIHKNKYKKSSLDNFYNKETAENEIIAYFKENQPKTYKEAVETIKRKFNIKISLSATRRYLNKHNIFTSKKR